MSALPAAAQAVLAARLAGAVEAASTAARTPVDGGSGGGRDPETGAFDMLPAGVQAKAEARHTLLLSVERLVSQGRPVSGAVDTVAAAAGLSRSTLWRSWQTVRGLPRDRWLAALAPRYRGRVARREIPAEAWDRWRADYLRPEGPPAAEACLERLRRDAEARGWQLPPACTFLRRLRAEMSADAILLARGGRRALEASVPAMRRDVTGLGALEVVNADGHRFDLFVQPPHLGGGIVRPTLVAFQDVRSSKILAWRLDVSEHREVVRLAFADLVRDWGIPQVVVLDNGRAFASKWMSGGQSTRYRFRVRPEEPEGVLTALGCRVSWTLPYSGRSKPIERAFRDLCEYIAQSPDVAGAYTGRSPTAKPENYGARALEWEEFAAIVDREIHAHNARTGRRGRDYAGRSFDAVFDASYQSQPIRMATDDQRRKLLLAADQVNVSRKDNAVEMLGNRYWSPGLAAAGLGGRKVVIRFDPARLDQPVHVYSPAGEYLCAAELVTTAGFLDATAAAAHARATRQHIKARRAELAAHRRVVATAPAVRPPPIEPARIVQPFGLEGRHAAPANEEEIDVNKLLAEGLAALTTRAAG